MLQFVQSPTHLSHITLSQNLSQPFRIKCERYIFLKKCVHSSLLLILLLHTSVYVTRRVGFMPFSQHQCEVKHKQLHPGFELGSLIPFPMLITVTLNAPLFLI